VIYKGKLEEVKCVPGKEEKEEVNLRKEIK